MLVEYLDVGGGGHALLHDLGGAEVGLAHHEVHLGGEVREVGGFLAGGVAAADDGHRLLAVEEAVARGAGRHARPGVLLLVGQAEVLGAGPGGDDDGVGLDAVRAVDGDGVGAAREVDRGDVAAADVGAVALGLEAHPFHEFEAVDRLGLAGEVLDVGGDGELSAGLHAGVEHGGEVGSSGVDGRRVARRARADDEAFEMFHMKGDCYPQPPEGACRGAPEG